MTSYDFNRFGITVPEILIPAKKLDLRAWGVVACDQYTQERAYWDRAERAREGKPSTLSLILPETFLAQKDTRVPEIHRVMHEYLNGGVFAEPLSGMMYVERTTAFGRTRRGLVTAIDLDAYDWNPQKKALIRATEATIVERIPARMDVRRNAPLETPHIMLLVDDPQKRLVEGCAAWVKKSGVQPAYNTDLMLDSGHITGYVLNCADALASIYNALENIARENTGSHGGTFLFAVGDGNHSLASAKAVWEEYKKSGTDKISGAAKNPARYALVEIVNIYDPGLTFEPIHRVLFNTNATELIAFAASRLGGAINTTQQEFIKQTHEQHIGFTHIANGKPVYQLINAHLKELAVSVLQPVLDEYLAAHKNSEIDYIHGEEEIFRLAKKENTVSAVLPPIAKESFFSTITQKGVLPRKSFSMGEANEKRFYYECRKLL